MRPLFKHPIECIKYIACASVPACALAYLGHQYQKTGDERLLSSINHFGDNFKSVVQKYGPRIAFAPERTERLVKQIEDIISDLTG